MSALRKITVSIAALFLGLTGVALTAGTAGADCDWGVKQCKMAD